MGMSALLTEDSLTYYLTTGSVITRPVAWEISLHSADPGVDGTANEVTDANYERQAIDFTVDITDPDVPFAENDALIEYPAADANYDVTHIVIWDSLGNVLVPQPLRVPKTVLATEQAQIAAGEIKIGAV